MTREEAIPSNEMILERARQASKDLRKRFREDLEQEPCDEYGNYKYPGDIELTEPNTATSMPCGDVISRQAVNALVDELARAISDERCFISRGRSTATIMQDILDLPPVNPQENERNCVTCERSKDGHSAGTEECHLCMWESQYKPKTGHWIRQTDDYHDYYECEHCGIAVGLDDIKNYCPNCGAKMIEPQESEEE